MRPALGKAIDRVTVRVGLAVAALALVLWALPARRAGEDGGHHGDHHAHLDAFGEGRRDRAQAKASAAPASGCARSPPTGRCRSRPSGDKLVVVNFWATWCAPCTVEMPALEALWQAYRARGLVVIGVSVDRGAPRGLLAPYLDHQRLTFPIVLDPDLAASKAWRVTSLPATFLVKPGGEVAGMAIGAREWNGAEMRALLETLLPAPR